MWQVPRRGKTLLVTSNIKPQVPLPCSKCETEGVFFCQHTLHPSLARKARRRGCSFVNTPSTPPSLEKRDGGGVAFVDTPSTPPLLETRDGGVFLLSTHHHPCSKLPCSKLPTTTTFLLETNDKRRSCPPPTLSCMAETPELSICARFWGFGSF